MTKLVAVTALFAVAASACVFDPQRHRRPARFQMGINTRQLAVPATPAADGAIARTSEPSASTAASEAATATGQFTLTTRHHLFVGAEIETGTLFRRGSNYAGAYGVLGIEHSTRSAAIGVEIAAGWRGIRPGFGERDQDAWVAEPRVRGQLWISPQVTFGATLGTALAERAWMAGIAFGFHSHEFDTFGRRR